MIKVIARIPKKFIPELVYYGPSTRRIRLRHPWQKLAPKLRNLFDQSQKIDSKLCFLEKNLFSSKCFSGYMACTFSNSATNVAAFCSPIILHSEFESSKILISTKILFPEMFHGTRKEPSWQTWNFLGQVKIFSKLSLLEVHYLPEKSCSQNGLLDT